MCREMEQIYSEGIESGELKKAYPLLHSKVKVGILCITIDKKENAKE